MSHNRSRKARAGAPVASGALVAAGGFAGLAPGTASASSHREAPAIAGQPQYDNTDVHAFVSPDRAGAVTLVGNWIPLPAIGIGTLLALAGGLARRRGLPPLPVTG